MNKTVLAVVVAGLLLGTIAVSAENATMHGSDLQRVGPAVHMKNFDVTLDGRLLTASEGIYHPDSDIVDLTGKVQLHFAPNARTDSKIR